MKDVEKRFMALPPAEQRTVDRVLVHDAQGDVTVDTKQASFKK
jgi:hypothetical protein